MGEKLLCVMCWEDFRLCLVVCLGCCCCLVWYLFWVVLVFSAATDALCLMFLKLYLLVYPTWWKVALGIGLSGVLCIRLFKSLLFCCPECNTFLMNGIWKYCVSMLILVCFSFFKTVIEAKDYEEVAGLWGSNCINAELLIKTGLSTKIVKI